MTVGTFHVGKTIEFPAIIKKLCCTREIFDRRRYVWIKIKFSVIFYNRLLEKNITPDNVVENQKQVTDELIGLLIEKN